MVKIFLIMHGCNIAYFFLCFIFLLVYLSGLNIKEEIKLVYILRDDGADLKIK